MTLDRRDHDRLRRAAAKCDQAVDRAYQERDDAIRQALTNGASLREVAEAVGLSKSAIAKIANR